MSSSETHFEKYKMFKADADNETNSVPIRIEAYFYSAFHLIEAITANTGIHIEKHQKVRTILENNKQIFGDNTEKLRRSFHEIENQIRPGQVYGGAIIWKETKQDKGTFSVNRNYLR